MNVPGFFRKTKAVLLRKIYRLMGASTWKGHSPQVAWKRFHATTPAGRLSLRVYTGDSTGNKPLVIYFHGGGWVLGDLESHHPFCKTLCHRSGCSVIAVDYRLAPEHPFPAAHDDCLAITNWVAANITELGSSSGKIVLAGDSAGANLATATCLELEPGVRQVVVGEVVIYPVTDHYESAFPSYKEKARGYNLTSSMMRWFWDTYLANTGTSPPDKQLQRATPLKAENLSSLPPTLLVTAENDPLRDEGIAYADKLRKAGVLVQYRHFEDAAHGFACSEGPTANFEFFMSDLVEWLHHLD